MASQANPPDKMKSLCNQFEGRESYISRVKRTGTWVITLGDVRGMLVILVERILPYRHSQGHRANVVHIVA